MKPKLIVIHHTASPSTATLSDIDGWHENRDFPKSKRGYYVGYHFVIGPDWYAQTRDENEIGAHAKTFNYNSLGVCLVGNFEKDTKLTYFQSDKLSWLLTLLMKNHKLTDQDIFLHRDVGQTACPGKYIDKRFVLSLLRLPVDSRYGEKRTWTSYMREKALGLNPYILAKIGRLPTTREISGLAYGFWPYSIVFEDRAGTIWWYQTKPAYLSTE